MMDSIEVTFNERRTKKKMIADVVNRLIGLRSDIEILRDEELMDLDNLPEELQQSAGGQKMESSISVLEDAIDSLENVEVSLEGAVEDEHD